MDRCLMSGTPWARAWARGLAVLSACVALGAGAEPVAIPSTPTAIQGTAERLISYRHQEHMWQTADGNVHAMVNIGQTANQASLQMFTSLDNGATWTAGLSLGNTNAMATSDSMLDGDDVYVTYPNRQGAVEVAQLHYDASTRSWSTVVVERAFESTQIYAFNPSVTLDRNGNFWLAFTSLDRATGEYGIRLLRKSNPFDGWVDTGMQFGPSDAVSIERSARPIATRYGVGMVYTVHDTTYWAFRRLDWPLDQAWSEQRIYTRQSPETDPFASHFSVVVDAGDNLHLAMVDDGRLLYFRKQAGVGTWSFVTATGPAKTAYAQVAVSGDTLLLIANAYTAMRVFQSTDGGDTWANTHLLTHPSATADTRYDRPRVEAPGHSASPVPVLQQYVDGGLERAMSFQVPVNAAP